MSHSSSDRLVVSVPSHAWFLVSAVFHYLGPSFAVLLFAHVEALGVAWLRIASAALVFALWRRPWRAFAGAGRSALSLSLALGATLAIMNATFYLAIARLPLGTVAAIEFVGTILVALWGIGSARNVAALALAVGGVALLTRVSFVADPIGLALAAGNAVLFVLYVGLGHRASRAGGGISGVDRLALSMLIAFVVVSPIGLRDAAVAFADPRLLGAGIVVGLSSSVVPYVCDQLAMARLPRQSFALMLSLLPATATVIGALVLHQIPSATDLAGVFLVILGVAIHQPPGSEIMAAD